MQRHNVRGLMAAAVIIFIAGCGSDGTAPPDGGELLLEVDVVKRERGTCEYQISADGSRLTQPAALVSGRVAFADYEFLLDRHDWYYPTDSIRPGERVPGRWLGHGERGSWRAQASWIYEVAGRTDTAHATIRCEW